MREIAKGFPGSPIMLREGGRLPRSQSGRLMEIPVLIALVGISIAAGVGQKSWLVGIGVLFGVPLGLFLVFAGWELLELLFILARARHAMASPATQLAGAQLLEANAYRYRSMKPVSEQASRALLVALGSPDPETRLSAASGLASLEREHEKALPVLIEALRVPDKRSRALESLRGLGRSAAPAVPGLIELLADRQSAEWWKVVLALQMIGPESRPAVPALIASLDELPVDEITWPIYALGAIGDRTAIPALEKLAKDGRDERVREKAREAVARIETATAAGVPR